MYIVLLLTSLSCFSAINVEVSRLANNVDVLVTIDGIEQRVIEGSAIRITNSSTALISIQSRYDYGQEICKHYKVGTPSVIAFLIINKGPYSLINECYYYIDENLNLYESTMDGYPFEPYNMRIIF